MIATYPTHGEVEFRVDKNKNAWCLQCQNEQIKAFLASDEGKAKISHAMRDAMLPPFGTGTLEGFEDIAEDLKKVGPITCHKPGTPGYVPPPPRPFGEIAGIHPVYADTYIRRVRVSEDPDEDEPA